METLIVYPESKEQAMAVKAFLKSLKVSFEKEGNGPYNQAFVEKIKRGEKAAKEGKGVKVDLDNLWK
ncbi:DUF2683 family protein [Mucilaginibacter psychrotolerans]|uniref:Uncharacterized protein n=1 Tax=Mucilaginibacter psychrotolerans TaxID=1524096 RepID=A0A4Y8S8J1_9SPHI|nr:DUF2683 family protein [Mucilaginibacter psychrotolerans]TFF34807.1 hypothetical protein E2R66_20710 [Mucilaginibacter psychrotolerans]